MVKVTNPEERSRPGRRTTRAQTAVRDCQMVRMLAMGLREAQVARQFGVSRQTVNRAVRRQIDFINKIRREEANG